MASGSEDHTIKIWNICTGELVFTLRGHTKPVNALISLPMNGYLVSSSDDCSVKVWDPNKGKLLFTLNGHSDSVTSLAKTSNGNVASGSNDHVIKIWHFW